MPLRAPAPRSVPTAARLRVTRLSEKRRTAGVRRATRSGGGSAAPPGALPMAFRHAPSLSGGTTGSSWQAPASGRNVPDLCWKAPLPSGGATDPHWQAPASFSHVPDSRRKAPLLSGGATASCWQAPASSSDVPDSRRKAPSPSGGLAGAHCQAPWPRGGGGFRRRIPAWSRRACPPAPLSSPLTSNCSPLS